MVDVFGSAVLAAVLIGGLMVACALIGWRLRSQQDADAIERQALEADIQWLRAALADSERRCEAQAGWIVDLESELVEALSVASGRTQPPLKIGKVAHSFKDAARAAR